MRLFTVCYNIYIVSIVAANVGRKKGEWCPLDTECCDERGDLLIQGVFWYLGVTSSWSHLHTMGNYTQ